jgi:Domain of unknown function (DUF5134)
MREGIATMVAPGWLAQALAGVMVGTAGYCLGRLIYAWAFRRRSEPGVDATHAAMGTATAGMLVPSLGTLSAAGWTVVFAATTIWFAWAMIRRDAATDSMPRANHLGHVLGSAAMVYMVVAMPAGPAAREMAGSMPTMASVATGSEQVPALGVILGLGLLGCAWWTALRLTGLSVPAGTGGGAVQVAARSRQRGSAGVGLLAPRLAAGCDLAIGVVMAYLVIGSA